MAVSGMVVTLSADRGRAGLALRALREHPSIEVGLGAERRLAITGDTPSPEQDRGLYEWVSRLPGVDKVDVVFVEVGRAPDSGGVEP
jgi:hypothetical protein